MNKKYSTYASIFTETPETAVLFDSWLRERMNDQDLRREAEMEMNDPASELPWQDRERLSAACDKYDDDIRVGQIRILSKRFTEDPDVIPYVAVLEQWDEGMWLVAPFSQYSTPATSGEMATGIAVFGLRVLQAWNGRTVQDRLLEKSFLFGQMDESLRGQALALFRHEFAGMDLPVGFPAQRGSAIVVEADPRRDYIAETIERMRPLSTAVKATERVLGEIYGSEEVENRGEDKTLAGEDEAAKGTGGLLRVDFGAAVERQKANTLTQPFFGSEAYAERLAAGNRDQQKTETFVVSETELSLTYSPEERCAVLTFYDKDDKPDGSYDGYAVLGTGFEFLGTFKDGSVRVPSELVKNWFQITDREGNAVTVVKKA